MIWTKGAHQGAKFQTFDYSREISPNLYFDRLFLLKVYKELCFMKLKNDAKKKQILLFQKWQEFGEFWPKHTRKSPKFALLLVPFCAKYMMFEWKFQHWEFDRVLLRKVENAWTKNLQRSLCNYTEEWCKMSRRNWLAISKLTWGIWQILTQALESLKHFHF